MKIPEYFTDKELLCHCGCGLMPPEHSIERLYALRMVLRYPFPISSGARCVTHNRAIKGKQGSIHLPEDLRAGDSKTWGGGAFDILIPQSKQGEFIAYAIACGFTGIGIARDFIHIDDAHRPSIQSWIY